MFLTSSWQPDDDLLMELRARLDEADYSSGGLGELFGADAGAALERQDPAPARRAVRRALFPHLRGRSLDDSWVAMLPRAVLAGLFRVRFPVSEDHLGAALGSLAAQRLLDARLIVPADPEPDRDGMGERHYTGAFRIAPEPLPASMSQVPETPGELLIASDWDSSALPGPLPADHVLGVGRATRTLADLTVREPVDTLVDLGTGCGFHALLGAWHARRVIGTDISERALGFARLNLHLNEERMPPGTEIEWREGSMLEPLMEPVDQIVSNPPFVITPRGTGTDIYEYRDGGQVGDGVVRALLQQGPAHLTPGGTAQFLANWEHAEAEAAPAAPALAALRKGRTPVHALLVERDLLSPAEYAHTWIRDSGEQPGSPDWQHATDAWLDDFEARGVHRIGMGWVLLRAPDEDETVAPVQLAERIVSPVADSTWLGTLLLARLDAEAWLSGVDDEELRALHLRIADDVTEERHFWPGRGDPSALLLRQGAGLGATVPSDTALSGLVGASDGELSVGQLAVALAGLLDVDEAALSTQLSGQVRRLIAMGILRPVPETGASG